MAGCAAASPYGSSACRPVFRTSRLHPHLHHYSSRASLNCLLLLIKSRRYSSKAGFHCNLFISQALLPIFPDCCSLQFCHIQPPHLIMVHHIDSMFPLFFGIINQSDITIMRKKELWELHKNRSPKGLHHAIFLSSSRSSSISSFNSRIRSSSSRLSRS